AADLAAWPAAVAPGGAGRCRHHRGMSRLAGVTPFPSDFAARYRERGYWEDVSLGRFYARVFASHGKRAAMISGSQRVTYAELRERDERLAMHLLALGVAPLDRR